MKKSIILAALTSIFSIASVQAGGFSWRISFGIGGGCAPVYAPPIVYVPVVYTQPVVVAQPVVQQVVYTAPAPVVVQPVCTIPVVNYYRPDCYRSPVTGTVWVGGASGGHRHHCGRR
jgi:hypothetical protein